MNYKNYFIVLTYIFQNILKNILNILKIYKQLNTEDFHIYSKYVEFCCISRTIFYRGNIGLSQSY